MTHPIITIIGAGHMGTSLLGGLISHGYPADAIFLTDPDADKLEEAKKHYPIHTTTQNVTAIQTADVILFAVKPDIIAVVAKELATIIQKRKPLIISIAAGISEKRIREQLGDHIPIVRAMPNMPALIGCGATALFANAATSAEQKKLAESILTSVGIVVWLDKESLMDAVTALSGSGPAYFYLLIEAMQNTGEKLGLPPEVARLLTLQTAYGAASLAKKSEKSASELRKQAMTPGGTTEQALSVLEKNHLRDMIEMAIQAATNRSKELDK